MSSVKSFFHIRWVIYSLLAATCIILTWKSYGYVYTGIDDANIYFVYMKHLAEGQGFVYNAGGEKVEGFTSFLWTFFGGLIFLIFSKPEQIIFILNFVVLSTGLGYFLAKTDSWLKATFPISLHSICILSFLYLIPGYFDWCGITLLETGVWSIALLLGLVNIIDYEHKEGKEKRKSNYQLALWMFLLPGIRPEAVIFGGFFAMARVIQNFTNQKEKSSYLPFVGLISSVLILTLFRIGYFGYPLPNTYYAKVSSNKNLTIREGIGYFNQYSLKWNLLFFVLSANTVVSFLISTTILFIKSFRNLPSRKIFLISSLCLISLLIPLYSGGDHFFMGRFFQPLIPSMLFLLFYVFFLLASMLNHKKIASYTIKIMPFLIVCVFIYRNPVKVTDFVKGKKSDIFIEFEIVADMKDRAIKIEDFFKSNHTLPSVGVSAAGTFAYCYSGQTIDLMGLNNVEMAHKSRLKIGLKNHSSFNIEVFLKQKPDIYLYTYLIVKDPSQYPFRRDGFFDWIYRDIMDNKAFRDVYFPVWIEQKQTHMFMQTWISDDFMSKIDTNLYKVVVAEAP